MSPLIPYGKQWIDDADIASVVDTLKSDFLTQGPAVERFEAEIRELTGAKYCVVVANATAGLHLAVAALGVETGNEGITSPISFVASANCLAYNGLTPCFADIEPRSYCMDPVELERKIGPKTKVVVPVDFTGQPADMASIKRIADRHNLRIVEDAAHAIGSRYPDGSPVGSCRYSDLSVFSFHPVKTITTGEGGAITTNDEQLFQRLSLLRTHGITRDPARLGCNPGPWYYEMQDLGFNFRMTDIQASLGSSQLRRLAGFKKRRREIVHTYNEAFAGLSRITTPFESEGSDSCFHLYVVKIDFESIGKSRADVMEELKTLGVGTQVHYIPIHLQPYYRNRYGYVPGSFPEAEAYYEGALSLPLYPLMSDKDMKIVIEAVERVLA